MPRLAAQDAIQRGDWKNIPTEEYGKVRSLFLVAYDDAEAAEEAVNRFIAMKVNPDG